MIIFSSHSKIHLNIIQIFCHSRLLKMRREMSDTNDFNILRHAMPIHALLCAKRKPFVEIQYASTPLSVLILQYKLTQQKIDI